jgi:hypothetical protein
MALGGAKLLKDLRVRPDASWRHLIVVARRLSELLESGLAGASKDLVVDEQDSSRRPGPKPPGRSPRTHARHQHGEDEPATFASVVTKAFRRQHPRPQVSPARAVQQTLDRIRAYVDAFPADLRFISPATSCW